MTDLTKDLSLDQALSLINSYAFDSGGSSAEELLQYWLNIYQASWIRLATIEALYLGRYKTVSIEQILSVWLRLGNPNTHFTYEFERLICRKLPKHLNNLSDLTPTVAAKDTTLDSNLIDSQTNSEILATDFTAVAGQFNKVKASQEVEMQDCLVTSNASSVLLQQSLSNLSESKQSVTATVDLVGLKSAVQTEKKLPSTVNSNLNQQSRMSLISALGLSYTPNWSELTGAKIIHQFIPIPDFSAFFNKLRAFAEEKLEEP